MAWSRSTGGMEGPGLPMVIGTLVSLQFELSSLSNFFNLHMSWDRMIFSTICVNSEGKQKKSKRES